MKLELPDKLLKEVQKKVLLARLESLKNEMNILFKDIMEFERKDY